MIFPIGVYPNAFWLRFFDDAVLVNDESRREFCKRQAIADNNLIFGNDCDVYCMLSLISLGGEPMIRTDLDGSEVVALRKSPVNFWIYTTD